MILYDETLAMKLRREEDAEAEAIAEEQHYDCQTCKDERALEVLGDGPNFECDVIGYKPCPDCVWEDPIQD